MKMLFYFLVTALTIIGNPVVAATLSSNNSAEYGLNLASPEQMRKYQLGTLVVKQQVRALKAKYDFATQGGAIGTIILKQDNGQPAVLPSRAVILNCIIDVQTTVASASGTVALSTGQTAADIKAATAAASYTGLVACIPVATAATSIKLTADRTMTATVATGALTAGKFAVLITYTLSD